MDEFLAVKLVGPTEVVDDSGDWLPRVRVTLVMCQLQIFDCGAVFVGAFGGSEIHAYAYIILTLYDQAINFNSCAYTFWTRHEMW
jgi:hypothetical protein